MTSRRKQRKQNYQITNPVKEHKVQYKPLNFRSQKQKELSDSIYNNAITFAIGSAGTGKTFISVAAAINMLKAGDINKIIITRPAIEAGEKLGFLPGTATEKLDVYLYPIYDSIDGIVGTYTRKKWLENGTLVILPIAYMRGITIDNCVAILDEAQNTTSRQMKMVLTRLGKNGKLIINGDPDQYDIPDSGLMYASECLKEVKGINTVTFDSEDVVRHSVVKEIIQKLK